MFFTTAVMAGPIVDPKAPIEFKPTVHKAENGTSVVNITTPSEAGVSLNQYEEFSVSAQGLVLNNSLQDGQSSLAGFLAANPNLSSRSASLIVNEVTGSSSSALLGQIEVFGDKASLIIANPYGIACNGCGFINTDSIALTTGRPIITGGQLDLDISSDAAISLAGNGLSTDASALSLIAGKINLNGNTVVAGELNLIAGDMLYDYSANRIKQSRSTNSQTLYAIDASQLGAMRAGSINIIVDGSNAGVRLMGYANAERGNFNIDADGNVSLRGTAAAGAITINSQGDVEQQKDFSAGRDISISANSLNVLSGGAIQTAEALNIDVLNQAVIYGDTQVRGKATINSGGGITIGEEFLAGSGIALSADGTVKFAEGIFSAPTLAVDAAATQTESGATVRVDESLLIEGGSVDLAVGSFLVADGASIEFSNNRLFDSGAQILARVISATGDIGSNEEGGIIQAEQLGLDFSERFSNAGSINVTGFDFINAPVFENLSTGRISAPAINVNGSLVNQGLLSHEGNLSLNATGSLTTTGTIVSTGVLDIDSSGALALGGTIQATENISASSLAGGIDINALNLLSGGSWNLDSHGEALTVNGLLAQAGEVNWQVSDVELAGEVRILTEDLQLDLSGAFVNSGNFSGFEKLQLNSSSFLNSGTLIAAGLLNVNSASFINEGLVAAPELQLAVESFQNLGELNANSLDITMQGVLDNSSGVLQVIDRFTLNSGGLNNEDGVIATGSFIANIAGAINNRSGLIDTQQITLAASSLDNQLGQIRLDEGSISLEEGLNNSGGQFLSNNLTLNAGSYTSDADSLIYALDGLEINIASELSNTGLIYGRNSLAISAGDLLNNSLIYSENNSITVQGLLNNQGQIHADILTLTAGELSNASLTNGSAASIFAKQSADISATVLNNDGWLSALDSLNITADTIYNNATIGGIQLPLTVGNEEFTGSGVLLVDTLSINAGTVVNGSAANQNGAILAQDTATISIENLFNNYGELYADDLTVQGAKLTNYGRTLAAKLTLDLADVVNHGLIQADGIDELSAQSFVNAEDARLIALEANLAIDGALENQSLIYVKNNLNATAGSLANSGLLNAGTLDLSVAALLQNSGDIIAASETALHSISAAALANESDASLRAAGNLSLLFSGNGISNQAALSNKGLIVSDKNLQLSGADIDNAEGAMLIALANIDGSAITGNIRNAGRIAAGDVDTKTGDLQLSANNITNLNTGLIYSAGDAALELSGELLNQASDNLFGTVFAENSLQISAGSVDNQSQISASDLSIQSRGELANGGAIVANNLQLSAEQLLNSHSGLISSSADIGATIDQAGENLGQIVAGETLNLVGASFNNAGTLSASDISLRISNELQNSGDILAANTFSIDAQAIANQRTGRIHAANQLGSTENTIKLSGLLSNTGEVFAADALSINAGAANNSGAIRAGEMNWQLGNNSAITLNNSGTIAAQSAWYSAGLGNGQLSINTVGEIENSGIIAAEQAAFEAMALRNIDGLISSSGDLSLKLQQRLFNQSSAADGLIQAGGKFNLETQAIENHGLLLALAGLDIKADSLLNTLSINSRASINLNLTAELNNQGALIASDKATINAQSVNIDTATAAVAFLQAGSIELNVPTISIGEKGVLLSEADLALNNFTQLSNAGFIQALSSEWAASGAGSEFLNNGIVLLDSLQVDNLQRYQSVAGVLDVQQDATLDISALSNSLIAISQGAQLVSRAGHLSLAAHTISNDSSLIDGVAALTLKTDTYENLGAAVLNGGDVHLDIRRLVNSGLLGGNLLGGTGLEEVVNNGGVISADGINWNLKSLQNINGQIDSTGDINIVTDVFDNSGGNLYANSGSIDLNVNNSFSNSGNIVASDNLTVDASSLANTGLMAAGTMQLSGRSIQQAGNFQSSGQLSLLANNDLIFSAGSVTRAGSLTATASSISNQGTITGAGSANFNANAGDFSNAADILFSGIRVNARNIVNTGLLSSNGSDSFNAQTLSNSGSIYGGSSRFQISDTLRNLGVISSLRDIDVTAPTVLNRGGYLAGANVSIDAADIIDNSGGVLYSTAGSLSLDTAQLVLANLQTAKNVSESETVDLVTASDSDKATAVADIANQLEQDLQGVTDQAQKDALIAAASAAIQGELPGISEAEQSALSMLLSQQGDNPDNTVEIVQQSLVYASGQLDINVGSDLKVEGDVSGLAGAHIVVAGGIEQQGRIATVDNLSLEFDGEFISDRSALSTLNSGGEVFVGPNGEQLNDQVYTASRGNISLSGAENIRLINASLQAGNVLSIQDSEEAELSLSGEKSRIFAANHLDISSGIKSIRIDTVNENNNIEVRNANIKLSENFTNSGNVRSSGFIHIDVGGKLNLEAGSMLHGDTVELKLNEQPDLSQEAIKADSRLLLDLPEFNLASGETLRIDGTIDIRADGAIRNSGRIISRAHGINLEGRSITNNSGATLLATGSINANSSGTFSNSGYIASFSSIGLSGDQGAFNNGSGTIASKGSVLLAGNRAANDGIILAEHNVTLRASTIAANFGGIEASSMVFEGSSGGNFGILNLDSVEGLTFVGFSQDDIDNSDPPSDDGAPTVSPGATGTTPAGLNDVGEDDFEFASANNNNRSAAGASGVVNTGSGANIAGAANTQRRNLNPLDTLRQQALGGDIDDALASELLAGPVSGSLASNTQRPTAPSALDLDSLFAGISVNPQAAPDPDGNPDTLPNQPNPLADPANLSDEERVAATQVKVTVSDEEFEEALAAASPEGARPGSFWDTSALANSVAELNSRKLAAISKPDTQLNPAFNDIASLVGGGFTLPDLGNLLREFGDLDYLADYTGDLTGSEEAKGFAKLLGASDGLASIDASKLTFDELLNSDSGELLADGRFVNAGEINTRAHTRFVLDDQELLGEVAEETLAFLAGLPATAAGPESTGPANDSFSGPNQQENALASDTLAQLGLEFKPDENGKMDLSGHSIAGRALDNVEVRQDENGNLSLAVADQRRAISLGHMAGAFSANADGSYSDENGNSISQAEFQAQVAANNPQLFANNSASDTAAQNRSDYFNSILTRTDANSLSNVAAGGVTIVGRPDADGNYTRLAGEFTNTGMINTGNLTVMAQGMNLGEHSQINTRGDLYVDVKNDIDLGQGRNLNIGNNFIARAGGDIKLQAQSNESSTTSGNITTTQVNHDLASLVVAGNLLWDAGNDVILRGASLNVGGAAQIRAGQDVLIEAVANSHSQTEQRKNFEETFSSVTHHGSAINSVGDLSILAGNNLDIIGSSIAAGNDDFQSNISLAAGGDMTIASVTDEEYHYRYHRKKKSFGRSKTYTQESLDSANIASSVVATGSVLINTIIDEGGAVGITNSDSVSIVGSNIVAGDRAIVAAQNNVEILSAVEEFGAYNQSRKSGFLGLSKSNNSQLETQARHVGSNVAAGVDAQVLAGNDLNLRASNVAASNDVELRAGILNEAGSLTLNAGTDTQYNREVSFKKRTGLIVTGNGIAVSAAKEKGQETLSNTSVGSTVAGGGDGTLVAAEDVNLIGSLVDVGGKLRINAGRDVNILDKDQTLNTTTWNNEKTTGISFSADRNSVSAFAGKITEKEKITNSNTNNAPSVLNSGDDLIVQAGRDINQVGSIVNSGKDAIYIAENNINISAGINQSSQERNFESSRSGLGVSIQHNVGNTLDSLQNIGGGNGVSQASSVLAAVDAVSSFTQGPTASIHLGNSSSSTNSTSIQQLANNSQINAVGNVLLKAGNDATLAGANVDAGKTIAVAANNINILAVDQLFQNTNESESASSGVVIRGGGNQASIGVAHSQGNSDSSQSGSQAAISTLNANNISLVAKNDLLIEGANIDALNDIELSAANDISITSAQSNSDSSFNSDSMNAGAGLGVTVGQGGASVGYYVEGGFSKEDLERQSNTHQNANINAGGNLVINSGRDTTVSGAHIEGEDVDIDVAGDLSVASLQDTASADGQRSDANLSVTVGYGVSVSGSAGYGETQGNKAWVENQTSIVGLNSVDIDVEGHTQIDGALIANIDENGEDQGNLELTTGSIGFSDIEGVDEESSRYVNISGGFTSEANSSNSSAGTGPGQRNRGGVDQNGVTSWGVNGYNNERNREQTTRATVGEGNITVTGGEGNGEEQLAGLNRDINNAQEVTRDEKSETNLYVTSSSVDSALSPGQTLAQWQQGLANYGANTLEAIKSLERGKELGDLVIDAFTEHGVGGGFEKTLATSAHLAASWQLSKYHPELLAKIVDKTATAEEVEEAYQAYVDIYGDITNSDDLDVAVIISEIDAKGATDGQGDVYINHGEEGTSRSDGSEAIGVLAHETAHNSNDSSEANADYLGEKAQEIFRNEADRAGVEVGEHSDSDQRQWVEDNRDSALVVANNEQFYNEDPATLRFYNEAGHYYTTFFVGLSHGIDPEVIAVVAQFSQLPDEVNGLDAMSSRARAAVVDVASFFGAEIGSGSTRDQMLVIYNRLHSLTGGDAVAMREEVSRRIIAADTPEEKGVLIHLLADSYAHTRLDDPSKLYGGESDELDLGHGLHGTAPDEIHRRPDLYKAYVRNLVEVLTAGSTNQPSAEDIRKTQGRLIGAVNRAVENSYIDVESDSFDIGPEGEDGDYRLVHGAAALGTTQNIRELVLGTIEKDKLDLVDAPERNTLDHYRENSNDSLTDIGSYIENSTNTKEENQESRSIQINNSLSEAVNKVINGREGAEVSSPNTVEEKADDVNGDLNE